MKNSDDTIGNRTQGLPTCSAMPQQTVLPAACSNKRLCLTLINYKPSPNVDMLRIATGRNSEKCVVRRFRPCTNVIECILNLWFRASWFNVNQKVQLDATVCRHLFTAQSLYMFLVSQHPSSGVLKTVSATSGIGHNIIILLNVLQLPTVFSTVTCCTGL